jgi:uncharacterized membrane protein
MLVKNSILEKLAQRTQTFITTHANEIQIEYILLISLTVLGGLLRFYKLGTWSFWGDEVFTLSPKEDGFNYSIWRRSLATTLIRATVSALGENEWNARLIPTIIGVLSIPLLYFFIKRAFDKPVALASSLLLALSPWHIYWSQNARFYILLLLFYSLGILTFYIGLEEDRPWWIFASLVLFGLAARERLLALFFAPILVSYLVLLKFFPFRPPAGLRWKNLLLFFSPGIVLGLFFAGPYLANFGQWTAGFSRINNSPLWILFGIVAYLGLATVCLGFFSAIFLLARGDRGALYLGLGAGIPVLGVMAVSMFQYSANRYAFVSLACWIILAGLAVRELFSNTVSYGKILAFGVFFLLIAAAAGEDYLYFNYQNGNRPDWRTAFEFIRTNQLPGDRIFSSDTDMADYYLREKSGTLQIFDFNRPEWLSKRTWFIDDLNAEDLYPEQVAWIHAHALQVANYDVRVNVRLFPMRVYLYVPNPP